jgi:tRNA (guanine37-N1)-methyltransferase
MASWRELAKTVLSAAEAKKMRSSFDTIGDIAVVEIARGLAKKERRLASLLLKSQPNIKVVAKKQGGHVGTYRRQPLKVIGGEKRLVTTHKESGCLFRLDVAKCYFSPRLAGERMRLARQVRHGEDVLVLFAGVAPFSIIIARHSRPRLVDSVELNPVSHKYAVENIALNKVAQAVRPVKADAARFLSRKGSYDRIVLAWPGRAQPYLVHSLKQLRKRGVLHYYDFAGEDTLADAAEKVRQACRKAGRLCVVRGVHVCGQKEPRVVRVCVDAEVR